MAKDQPMTLTLAEAAELAGRDYRTIKALVENGSVPALRLGSRVLIPRAAFVRLLETGSAELQEAK